MTWLKDNHSRYVSARGHQHLVVTCGLVISSNSGSPQYALALDGYLAGAYFELARRKILFRASRGVLAV